MNFAAVTNSAMDIDEPAPSARRQQVIAQMEKEVEALEEKLLECSGHIHDAEQALAQAEDEDESDRLTQIQEEWRKKRSLYTSKLEQANKALEPFLAKARKLEQRESLRQQQEQKQAQADDRKLQNLLRLKPTKVALKDSNQAEEFIKSFNEFVEIQLPGSSDRKTFILPLLTHSMKEEPKHAVFLRKLHNDKVKYWDLVELKNEFLNHYSGQSWHASQAAQLANIAMGFEQPSDYIGRIMQKTSQMGIQLNIPMDEGTVRMVKGWYFQLPHNVQQSMASEMSGIYENGTIQAYLDAIQRHVPQKPERVEPCPLYCPYCPNRVEFNCACETMRRLNAKRPIKSNRDPRAQENRAPHHQKSERNGSVTHFIEKKTRFENPPAPRRCFKCDAADWTPAHKCKGRSVSNAILEKPNVPEVAGIWERDDLELSEESGIITSAISARENLARSRPAIDLVLNGKLIKGLFVDTMSDFSVLRADLLAGLRKGSKRIAVRSDNAPNVMTANGSPMDLAGVVELPVKVGETEFQHQFLVSRDLPTPITALLGNDILPKIGVRLVGLEDLKNGEISTKTRLVASVVETSVATDGQDLGYPIEEVISKLVVADKKDLNYSDIVLTYRKRIMEELRDVLNDNKQLTGFCTHPRAEISFSTIDEEPVSVRQYDLPYMHRTTVTNQIRAWLDNGIIERCTSKHPSNNPLLVVPKHDLSGKIKAWRTCIDPRMINRKIRDPTYPLPKARYIFDRLAGMKVFSVIDLKSGFNQIKVKPSDRFKTAFTWDKRVYQFVGAPFGFKNIPQDFQGIMDNIFEDFDFVTVYIDDIIVHSSSWSDHPKHVLAVIRHLNRHNLKASLEKLKLAYPEIVVIGNKISDSGVTVAVEKLEKMDHWTGPVKTLKQLQQRLGFTNYFREYCPIYAKLMSPLEELRTQGDNVVWLPVHDLIMKKFRDILGQQLMIEYPDFTKPLIVGTDASKYGIGGVLYQMVGDCDDLTDVQELVKQPKRYIRFASRALTPSERNYGAPQRELLGVLFALRTFRPYLFGRSFRLLTDHKSLTYMLERPKVSSVIFNWLDEILQFNFKIEHVPGILNLLPDKISRIYDFDEREEASPLVLTVLNETEQTMDMEDLEVIEDLEVRKTILERAHVLGHFGAADMARTIRSTTRSTWPNLARDCQKLVSACIPCQRYNIGKMGYHPIKSIQAILPLDHIAIDLKSMPTSKHGNAYYLLIIDVATRFVFLRPLVSKSAYSVAQTLLRLFCDLGFPKILQSDNGGEFVNEVMAALKKLGGFDHRLISAYHHRSNGIAERAIQSTSHAIYKSMGGLISQWDEYLPAIQYAFNTRVVELHGSSPYALMFGRAPNGFQDYRDTEIQLEKESDRENRLLFLNSIVFPAVFEKVGRVHSKRQLDFAKSHRMLKEDYPPGTQVMIKDEMKSAKHQPSYEGPFTVVRRKESGNYELKGVGGAIYTRAPWVLKQVAPEIVKDLNIENTLYKAVDHIVEHRDLPDGTVQYRVRWEKEGPELDSWLFASDFVDYGPLQTYTKQMGVDKRCKQPKTKFVTGNTKLSVKSPIRKKLPHQIPMESQVVETTLEETGADKQNLSPLEIYLDKQQKDALGDYWKSTSGSRRVRRDAIVDSDSD